MVSWVWMGRGPGLCLEQMEAFPLAYTDVPVLGGKRVYLGAAPPHVGKK